MDSLCIRTYVNVCPLHFPPCPTPSLGQASISQSGDCRETEDISQEGLSSFKSVWLRPQALGFCQNVEVAQSLDPQRTSCLRSKTHSLRLLEAHSVDDVRCGIFGLYSSGKLFRQGDKDVSTPTSDKALWWFRSLFIHASRTALVQHCCLASTEARIRE